MTRYRGIPYIQLPNWWPIKGRSWTFWVMFIAPNDRGDRVTLAHEWVHADQQRCYGPFRWLWRYLRSKRMRKVSEAEAFAASCRAEAKRDGNVVLPRAYVTHYAAHLAKSYRLDITQAEAEAAIRRWL